MLSFNRSMPSPKQHNFARAVPPDIKRSTFDRSTSHKTAIDPGKLYPLLVDELLPADTVGINTTIFARVNPMVVPPMDNLYLDLHAFFIPARLVWDNWVKLMGEQANPDDSIDYTVPRLYSGDSPNDALTFGIGSLFDYLGLPVGVEITQGSDPDEEIPIASLIPRAYNLVWNEWFRDQNFQDSVECPLDDGPDPVGLFSLLNRGKRHDYFTSSLPSPQKGPAVTISLAGTAPVIGNGKAMGLTEDPDLSPLWLGAPAGVNLATYTNPSSPPDVGPGTVSGALTYTESTALGLSTNPLHSGVVANLSSVSVLSINELRTAVSVQQLLELYARSGTRYTEILQSEFDVFPEDARLQRPEFLGGSSQIIAFDAVPQTSAPTEDNPQASLAANGHVVSQLSFSYNVKEHGYLMILGSVRADLTYQGGLRRMWSRRTRYDFYHPAFANLGEQAVLKKEFQVLDPGSATEYNNSVWGYQERFAEYRYFPSLITGKFRSPPTTVEPPPWATLDPWHYALRYDGTAVALDANFIQDNPQLRALAVLSEPAVFVDAHFGFRHTRPMPVYSVPGLRRF